MRALKVGNAFDISTVCSHLACVCVRHSKAIFGIDLPHCLFSRSCFALRAFAAFPLCFFFRHSGSSSIAWHSTANAFQRKVFKQIFAQLALAALAGWKVVACQCPGVGDGRRATGGPERGLHVSFFLFFAPAFKQCAARRTVQGWSPGTPLLASHKMSNGAPCGMQQFFLLFCSRALLLCLFWVSVCGCAPFIFAPSSSSSSKANKWHKNVFATV